MVRKHLENCKNPSFWLTCCDCGAEVEIQLRHIDMNETLKCQSCSQEMDFNAQNILVNIADNIEKYVAFQSNRVPKENMAIKSKPINAGFKIFVDWKEKLPE